MPDRRARSGQNIVDFIIFNRILDIVVIIELDDRTHVAEQDEATMTESATGPFAMSRATSRRERIRSDIEHLLKR